MTTFSRRDRNTGPLGPEARSIFDEELKAWADLEGEELRNRLDAGLIPLRKTIDYA